MDSKSPSPGNLNLNDNSDESMASSGSMDGQYMSFWLNLDELNMDLDLDLEKELEKQLGDPTDIMELMGQLGQNEPAFAIASGGEEAASSNLGPAAPSSRASKRKTKSGRVGKTTAPTPAGKARKRQPRPRKTKLWEQDPEVVPGAKGAITARNRRQRMKRQTLDLQLEVKSLKLQLQAEKAFNEELRREVAKLKAERGRK